MEQNLVSDEELLKRINKVLKDSKPEGRHFVAENRQEESSNENFQDVCETLEVSNADIDSSEVKISGVQKNLVLENQYLSLELEEEKKKSQELQTKFKLFESSVKYFERLNGQLKNIKRAIEGEEFDKGELEELNSEEMQKIRPKNIHTAANGSVAVSNVGEQFNKGVTKFCEPIEKELDQAEDKEEVAFRDAEDFKQLEQGLEIVKDKSSDRDPETEKVFITKTEKRCLEDIGNIAARTRTPLDEKHQKYFERDRRKFANSIVMPDIQEVEKTESVPLEIISKTKETPVNITSTELDGLRSYLIQLKELIARRETAWARTTERDYSQRVEITRFKNEVSHLRMLCEKRQKDLKERDQVIASKDEEIRELQKRIQGLRNAIMKLEKKDDKIMDTIDGITNEVLENSQMVQRSYNAMKRQSLMNRVGLTGSLNASMAKTPANITLPSYKSKDISDKKSKYLSEKSSFRKINPTDSVSNVDGKKSKGSTKSKVRHKNDSGLKTKDSFDRVDEKLQRVEEMLHNEVLKGMKKSQTANKMTKMQNDAKAFLKNQMMEKNLSEFSSFRKSSTSSSQVRQEMLTAMTGLNGNPGMGLRSGVFLDPKKNNATAAVIANALLAARNANLFN